MKSIKVKPQKPMPRLRKLLMLAHRTLKGVPKAGCCYPAYYSLKVKTFESYAKDSGKAEDAKKVLVELRNLKLVGHKLI